MPIHVLQYVIHAQKRSCTHLSFGTYVQKRRVIFVHALPVNVVCESHEIFKKTSPVFLELSAQIYR